MSSLSDFANALGTDAPVQAATNVLPATIPFTYEGQVYQVSTAGFNSEEEAIDAFLQGQNTPQSIEPTDVQGTNVVADEDIFGGFSGVGTLAPEESTPIEPEEELDDELGFSGDVARRDFSRGAVNMVGEGLQGIAVTGVSQARDVIGKGRISSIGGGDDFRDLSGFEAQNKRDPDAPLPGIKTLLEDSTFQAGGKVKDFAEEFFPTDERYNNTVQRKLAEGGGSLVAFAASAMGTPVLTAAFGGSVNASSQFADAISSGATFEEAIKAADIGFAAGTTEALPIMGVLERLDKGTGGIFSKKLAKTIKDKLGSAGEIAVSGVSGAIEEGIQEGLMDLINNVSAKDIVGYDPSRDRFEGTGESAAIGGTLGFVLNTVASGLGIGKRNIQAGAEKRLEKDLQGLLEQEDKAAVPDLIDQDSTEGIPDIQNTIPDVQQVGQEGTPANDPIRQQVMRELGLADQLDLDLPEIVPEQQTLDLRRDFHAAGQFPDSGTQQELGLEDTSAFGVQEGPAAEVTHLFPKEVKEEAAPEVQEQLEYPEGTPSYRDTQDRVGEISTQANEDALNRSESEWAKGKPKKLVEDVDKIVRQALRTGVGTGSIDELGLNRLKQIARTKSISPYLIDIIEQQTFNGELDVDRFAEELTWELVRERTGVDSYDRNYKESLKLSVDKEGNPRIGIDPEDGGMFFREFPAAPVKAEAEQIEADATAQRQGASAEVVDLDRRRMPELSTDIPRNIKVRVGSNRTLVRGLEDGLIMADMEGNETSSVSPDGTGSGNPREVALLKQWQRRLTEPTTPVKLNRAEQQRAADEGLDSEIRREVDELEQHGISGQTLENEARQGDTEFDEALAGLRQAQEDGNLGVIPASPTSTVIEGGRQQRLPLKPQTLEPAFNQTQAELPLEGGGQGTGGTLPPIPPRQPPTGGTNQPTNVAGTRMSLVTVAESRPIAGEPTTVIVSEDGDGISAGGRSYKNNRRDTNKEWSHVPYKFRRWLDIALTSSLIPGRVDIKVTREIIRELGASGRAMAETTNSLINKIENTYKAKTGKKLKDAPQEEQKRFTEYMNGQVGRSVVIAETSATEEFLDVIDEARIGIQEMSTAMLQGDMIPAELRLTFEENAGSYLSVSYAANVLNQDVSSAETLAKIPVAIRNKWMNTFVNAYINPIRNQDLDTRSRAELQRMVQALGLTERRRVADPEGEPGAEKDIIILKGDTSLTPYERVTKADLAAALSETGGMAVDELTNAMLRMLNSTAGSISGGRGRDHSIERRKTLARNAQELKDAGFTQAEIDHNQSTRELLMETVDPVTNIGITMNKMMSSIISHRIINDISSLHAAGLVSLGKKDEKAGLTELLVPRGHSMADVRIPNPDKPGEYIYASLQGDAASKGDGIFVSPRLARVFQHIMKPAEQSDGLVNLARWFTGMTKVNLTAFSPRSHPRNMGTAAMLLAVRGHALTDPAVLMKSIGIIGEMGLRDLGNRGISSNENLAQRQDENDTVLAYLSALGLFNDSVRSGPVRELLTKVLESKDVEALGSNTYMDQNYQPIEGQLDQLSRKGATKIGRAVAKVAEKPMALFRLEDEAVKAMAFMIERRRHAKMKGRQDLVDMIDGKVAMTENNLAELREYDRGIAKYITDLYPTYSRVPAAIRALSRSIWVTPFPSFTAEMWRNGLNDYKDLAALAKGTGRYEGIDANKRNALFTTRVATKGAYNVAIGGMVSSATGIAMSGLSAVGLDPTDDELDDALEATRKVNQGKPINSQSLDMAIRVIAPMYLADSLYQIVDYKPAETLIIRNLAYSLPNSQQLETGYGIWNSIEMMFGQGDYERAGKRLLSTTYKLVSDYVKPDVLAATMLEVIKGKTATGYPIWDQTDDAFERSVKSAEHIMSVAGPGSRVLLEGGKFVDAWREDTGINEMQEFLMGINDTTFRIDTLWGGKMRVLSNDPSSISNSTTEINRLIQSNETMSDKEFVTEYLALEEQRYEAFNQMRILARAGESLGMDRRQMQKIIDSNQGLSNPGGMDVKNFLREKYIPYEPTKQDAFDGFRPKKAGRLSPEQKKEARDNNKDIIRDRLRLIKDYKDQVRDLDFTY